MGIIPEKRILSGKSSRTCSAIWVYRNAQTILFVVLVEFIGTRFSAHRNWIFRLNNGGGLVCTFINFFAIFPMIGNWYPANYEKSKDFSRDMGITALTGWVSLLILVGFLAFSGVENAGARFVWQTGIFLLCYRVIPFYPFESCGGRRVFQWNKWIYAFMVLATLAVVFCSFVFD